VNLLPRATRTLESILAWKINWGFEPKAVKGRFQTLCLASDCHGSTDAYIPPIFGAFHILWLFVNYGSLLSTKDVWVEHLYIPPNSQHSVSSCLLLEFISQNKRCMNPPFWLPRLKLRPFVIAFKICVWQ
jgi:hypothetical protein